MASIFKQPIGAVYNLDLPSGGSNVAFVSIVTKELSDVLDCWAPLQGITISQKSDHSVTKSLYSDFLIAAFGEQPVSIVLSGLCTYSCPAGVNGDNSKAKSGLAELYQKLRISEDVDNNRVELGIYSTPRGTLMKFKCAIVGLELDANAQTFSSGACAYRMTLIGVEA